MASKPAKGLSCFKVSCGGEFAYVGDERRDTLYECRECGATLSQSATKQLADGDTSVAELAKALLNREAT